MKLIEALRPDIRRELERSGIAELVSVSVSAMADPDMEEGEFAMKIDAYVGDNFKAGIPAIDQALEAVDAIATAGDEDFAPSLRDTLRVMLGGGQPGAIRLHEGAVNDRPAGNPPDPGTPGNVPLPGKPDSCPLVWIMGWSVATDEPADAAADPGRHHYNTEKLLVYSDDVDISEFVDEDSWTRIKDRIRRIDLIIGGMVAGMMGEG
jgi:hypothetical protein